MKVSVIMPLLNAGRYLNESMQSILNQNFDDFELIIIDGNSTDNSLDLVKKYNDKRIKLFCNSHDLVESLNLGIKHATGKYIARMDADDIMMPNRLELQYDFLEKNQTVDVLGGWFETFGATNVLVKVPLENNQIVSTFLIRNNICHGSTMIRKSTLDKICNNEQIYNPNFIYAEDYKLWIELAKKKCQFANLPKILIKYRRSTDNKQITSVKRREINEKTQKIILDYNLFIIEEIKNKYTNMENIIQEIETLYTKKEISDKCLFNFIFSLYQDILMS